MPVTASGYTADNEWSLIKKKCIKLSNYSINYV